MRFVLQPWQLLLSIVAGWINDEQQKIIEYERTVIQVLLEKMGKKRLLLNDDQRRRLAVKGKILGRKVLAQVGALFTPDTILRWHRQLVAQKWDHSDQRRKVGRPPTAQEIVALILQFAKENPTWGYDRIADALGNIGHKVSDQTVGNVLKRHGIEPAPDRKRTTTWATFLRAHWDQLAAIDFTTVEVWTYRGLVTYYLLCAMRLATRQVCYLACTPNPDRSWMAQMARNLTDAFDGLLRAPVRYVLLDRDTKFTAEFQAMLRAANVEPVLLPPKQSQERVGFAAAKVGLKLHDRIAPLAGHAQQGPLKKLLEALGQKGTAEELFGVLVFIRAFFLVHLPQVGGEFGLLIAA